MYDTQAIYGDFVDANAAKLINFLIILFTGPYTKWPITEGQ